MCPSTSSTTTGDPGSCSTASERRSGPRSTDAAPLPHGREAHGAAGNHGEAGGSRARRRPGETGSAEDAIGVAYSYERVTPGASYLDSIVAMPRTYAGHTVAAADACEAFLSSIIDVDAPTGYEPQVHLTSGIRRTHSWYRTHVFGGQPALPRAPGGGVSGSPLTGWSERGSAGCRSGGPRPS